MAEDLQVGDKIVTSFGDIKEIISNDVDIVSVPDKIYNLNVEDYHTYFVGNQGLLVHNDCSPKMISETNQAIENAEAKSVTDPSELMKIGEGAAEAWQRLIDGTQNDTDILLLNHELFESNYMRANNCTHDVAHAEANKLYNWSMEVFGE